MKITKIVMFALSGILSTASVADAKDSGQLSRSEWTTLNRVNEPAGQVSLVAARTATQGMTRAQIKAKKIRLEILLKRATPVANGTAIQILKREVQLLQLAEAE